MTAAFEKDPPYPVAGVKAQVAKAAANGKGTPTTAKTEAATSQ